MASARKEKVEILITWQFYSVQAAITNCFRLCGLNNEMFVSQDSEGWEVQDQGTGRVGV